MIQKMACCLIKHFFLLTEILFLIAALSIFVEIGSAEALQDDNLFEVSNHTIVGYTGNVEHLVIPNTVYGVEIREIGSYVFRDHTELKTVTFPSELTRIGSYCFSGCSSLEKLIGFEKTNISTIEKGLFEKCTRLFHVDLPGSVELIKYDAFWQVPLTSLTLPLSVKYVEKLALNSSIYYIRILNPNLEFEEDALRYLSSIFDVPVGSPVYDAIQAAKCRCAVESDRDFGLLYPLSTSPDSPSVFISDDILDFSNRDGVLFSGFEGHWSSMSRTQSVVFTHLFPNYAWYMSGEDNKYAVADFTDFWGNDNYPIRVSVILFKNEDSGIITSPTYYLEIRQGRQVLEPSVTKSPWKATALSDRMMCPLAPMELEWEATEDATYKVSLYRYHGAEQEGGTAYFGVPVYESKLLYEPHMILPADLYMEHGMMYSIEISAYENNGSNRATYRSDHFIAVQFADQGRRIDIPTKVTRIEDEAFINNSLIEEVRISTGTLQSIGDRAFANCPNLRVAVITSSAVVIGEDAFSGCPNLVIVCDEDSEACRYAKNNAIVYIPMKADSTVID